MSNKEIKEAQDLEMRDYKNKALATEIAEAIEAICLRHDFDLKAFTFTLVNSQNNTPMGFKMLNANKGQIFSLCDAMNKNFNDIEYHLKNFEKLYGKPKK